MNTTDALRATSKLYAYSAYIQRKFGAEYAYKIDHVKEIIEHAVNVALDNDTELTPNIDILVESILNIKAEEFEPIIINDFQVLAEAD